MMSLRTLAAACAFSALMLSPALAQDAAPAAPAAGAPTYVPESGQPGKDVVWVPTQESLVEKMLDMAAVTADDYVIDLGSGDGRTVIQAAKRGARAHGIEYNPDLVELSKSAAAKEGVQDRATFEKADIFESDFSEATVVTLFLLPELNIKLRPTLLDMAPGTRVVSNTFHMGEWEPDESVEGAAGCTSFCRAHKWVIPARVAGEWRLGEATLKLEQTFQKLSGTLTLGGRSMPIGDARMNGTEISFEAGGKRYRGTIEAGRMTGTADGESWAASRVES